MDCTQVTFLTFDCYGTLIDWERGILGALQPYLKSHGIEVPDDELLRLYGKFEPEEEHGDYKPYREVLRGVMKRLGEYFDIATTDADLRLLENSLPYWPPFADTVQSLSRLASKYKLVVISNIDRDLIESSAELLGNPFHALITAQDVQAYKPDPRNFLFAREQLGLTRENHCHVAQSLFHDIAPAKSLGMNTIWIDRRKGAGGGATPDSEAKPDLRFETLAEMAQFMSA